MLPLECYEVWKLIFELCTDNVSPLCTCEIVSWQCVCVADELGLNIIAVRFVLAKDTSTWENTRMVAHEVRRQCHHKRMFLHFLLCILLISNNQFFLARS